MRTFLLGWRVVLGLGLGPLTDPRYVLGWRIATSEREKLRLEQDSWLIAAANVITLEGTNVTWTTHVRYTSRLARTIWTLLLPVHKLTNTWRLRICARTPPAN
ncbi:DUF2867 domain-containing protein [Saccharopolyspora mangrovi]|uniref:Secreted protein n=1 Tax=Saccharopolyspora mangrovi TaxID=3082379 RepID=A0ABU6AHB0_9PSEU|nr:DUF2867 domain-containing protein [Saccharopolyspora sp. S2-29]MEB3370878.1 hypothetical protein [Saccharopolyspora sp. S2-29]